MSLRFSLVYIAIVDCTPYNLCSAYHQRHTTLAFSFRLKRKTVLNYCELSVRLLIFLLLYVRNK
jgi:hypothetical protein